MSLRPLRKDEFEPEDDRFICEFYAGRHLHADYWAYHRFLDELTIQLQVRTGKPFTPAQVWRRLLNLRRKGEEKGGLPRLGRDGGKPLFSGTSEPPELTQPEVAWIVKVIKADWGRNVDGMPYTSVFPVVAAKIRARTGRDLSDNTIHHLLVDFRRQGLLPPSSDKAA